jgi:hypothetical protein
MIRIRRVPSRVPFSRLYEIELAAHGRRQSGGRHVTRTPKAVLEPILGVGDAWSFVEEADRQWDAGRRGWAVEFEEE